MKQILLEMCVTGLGYGLGLMFIVLSVVSGLILLVITAAGESVARLRDGEIP